MPHSHFLCMFFVSRSHWMKWEHWRKWVTQIHDIWFQWGTRRKRSIWIWVTMTANSQTHAILVTNRNTQMSDVISNFAFFLFHSFIRPHPSLVLSVHPVFVSSFFFNSSSCSFSLLHYCFLCILIFTKCQSNDEMPEMRRAKNEARGKKKTRICVSSARRKETCVVTILNDMLMEYKILNRKRLRCVQFCLKSLLVLNFPVELLHHDDEFRTFFVYYCDPSSRGERGIHNCNPWSVSNVNSNE